MRQAALDALLHLRAGLAGVHAAKRQGVVVGLEEILDGHVGVGALGFHHAQEEGGAGLLFERHFEVGGHGGEQSGGTRAEVVAEEFHEPDLRGPGGEADPARRAEREQRRAEVEVVVPEEMRNHEREHAGEQGVDEEAAAGDG